CIETHAVGCAGFFLDASHHRRPADAALPSIVSETPDLLSRRVDMVEMLAVPDQTVGDGQATQQLFRPVVMVDAVQGAPAGLTLFHHRAHPEAALRITLTIVEAHARAHRLRTAHARHDSRF